MKRLARVTLALLLALAGAYELPLGGDWHAPANVSHHPGYVESNGCSIQPDPSGDGTYWYKCP